MLEPLGDWIDACPWRSRKVMFLFRDDEGVIQALSVTEKKNLLSRLDGELLVFWPGQWSSSARYITGTQREAVLSKI